MHWADARRIAASHGTAAAPIDVTLDAALGYTLAAPLTALVPSPSYDSSAMDGYAVAGTGPWRVVGRVLAGDPTPAAPLAPGEAVEIATGAVVPPGAAAVIPYEDATTHEGPHGDGPHERGTKIVVRSVAQNGPPRPTDRTTSGTARPGPSAAKPHVPPAAKPHIPPSAKPHIRRTAEDHPAGAVLLPTGTVVSPAVVALAASTGHDTLRVHARPRVTGAEVCTHGLPAPGRVRDAIGPLLPGLVLAAGGEMYAAGGEMYAAGGEMYAAGGEISGAARLGDDRAALAEALRDTGSEVVVVCGATSVGAADHLRAALADVGARVLVRGVACRPGHPQLFAALPDGRAVVGLPGNPFAALVAAVTLLRPVVERLAGRAPRAARTVALQGVQSHPRDTRLVPVRVDGAAAVPVGHDRPGTLWGAALADALAVVPPLWTGTDPVELLSTW